jgi:hypothetical protein
MDSDLQTRVAQWAADNPAGAAALRAEGAAQERASMEAAQTAAIAAAQAEGARLERERVAAIRAVVPPGYQSVADQAIADGATADQAARAVCEAVKAQAETIAAGNAQHAPEAVTFAAAPTHQEEAGIGRVPSIITSPKDDEALANAALAYQARNPAVSFVDALKIVSQEAA